MTKAKKKTILITVLVLIALILGGIGIIRKLNRDNPFVDALDFTIPYTETLSKEENTEAWLKSYLDQDAQWHRMDKIIKDYSIKSVTYASLNYFKVEMDIEFRSGKTLNSIESVMYLDMLQMMDTYHLIGILSEKDYLLNNEYHDLSDVNNEESVEDMFQVKETTNGNSKISKNSGKTWVEIPVKYEELSNHYEIDKGKDKTALFYEYDTIMVVYTNKEGTNFIRSDDKGVTWVKTKIKVGNENEQFSSIGSASIVAVSNDEVVINGIVDAALGSVRNILVKSVDRGQSFAYLSELPSTKLLIDRGIDIQGKYYVLDRNDVLRVSESLDMNYHTVAVPEHGDDVWGYQFNDVYTALSVPFETSEGQLLMHVHQGPQGDIKVNARAEFLSNDKGETWSFVRYLQYKDKIVD